LGVLRALLVLGLLAGAGRAALAATPPPPSEGACIDEKVKADLDAKRRRRSAKERLVQKTNRHELGLRGGQYISDIFDTTYVVGALYAYHLTEDFAVEASGSYTRISSQGGPELERVFSVLGGHERQSLLFFSNLVWAPLHAKMQTGASVAHFDVSVTAGAGVVDSALSSGIAGNAGVGFMFFLGRALALRLDLRDYVYRQELLTRRLIVNDVAITAGLSVMLPFAE
jgi:outer membrane beta-barrel protein